LVDSVDIHNFNNIYNFLEQLRAYMRLQCIIFARVFNCPSYLTWFLRVVWIPAQKCVDFPARY